MLKTRLLFVALLGVIVGWQPVQGQTPDTFRVAFYNVLNFPGTTSTRADTLTTILNHLDCDVFIATEVVSTAGNSLLLNTSLANTGNPWAGTPFVDGPDSDQIVYYRSDKFGYKLHGVIPTALRDIYHARLYALSPELALGADTVFLDVFCCHLKASSGSTNEALRNAEAQAVRTYMDNNTTGVNVMIGGDYNWHSSTEDAYITLTALGNYTLYDPIDRPGNWNNNASFADIHTQSPRSTQFGGGADGGMDDRFDMFLVTQDLLAGTNGLQFVPGTYWTVGNDGQHFNLSILAAPLNTSVPYPVLTALHNMSDHLPIAMDLAFTQPAVGVADAARTPAPGLRANATNDVLRYWFSDVSSEDFELEITSLTGQTLRTQHVHNTMRTGQGSLGIEGLAAGTYLVRVRQAGGHAHAWVMMP